MGIDAVEIGTNYYGYGSVGKETKPPCLAFGTTINETWWAEGC